MTPETAAHYNRLARMSPEERDAEILRAAFGPHFANVFPSIAPPVVDTGCIDRFNAKYAEVYGKPAPDYNEAEDDRR